MNSQSPSYHECCFPSDISKHVVTVSYEAIREWCRTVGSEHG